MDVLGVTPNELLSGEWKYIDTDFVRKFLLFHSSVFSYGLYVLS